MTPELIGGRSMCSVRAASELAARDARQGAPRNEHGAQDKT